MKHIVLQSEGLFSGLSDDENLGAFVELVPGIEELKPQEIKSISGTMVAVMQTRLDIFFLTPKALISSFHVDAI